MGKGSHGLNAGKKRLPKLLLQHFTDYHSLIYWRTPADAAEAICLQLSINVCSLHRGQDGKPLTTCWISKKNPSAQIPNCFNCANCIPSSLPSFPRMATNILVLRLESEFNAIRRMTTSALRHTSTSSQPRPLTFDSSSMVIIFPVVTVGG